MRGRCPSSQFLGRGILSGFAFLINARGVATVLAAPEHVVYGAIWHLETSDEKRLDVYEGVADDFYRKRTLPVIFEEGQVRALVYLATDERRGDRARSGYVEKIVAAAREHDFPKEYLEALGQWLPTDS